MFSDARRFGGLRAFRSLPELDAHWATLGPDALNIQAEVLEEALQASRRIIKAALLDQGILAGVGNIYADEALFESRIHPETMSDRLEPEAVRRLAAAIRRVLGDACRAGGSTLQDFVSADGEPGSYQHNHRVYGRAGLLCLVCGTPLRSKFLAQRTTTWCSNCQPARKRPSRKRPS